MSENQLTTCVGCPHLEVPEDKCTAPARCTKSDRAQALMYSAPIDCPLTEKTSVFRAHLDEAREVVRTWPAWKQSLLGGTPVPGEEIFYVQDSRQTVGNCLYWRRPDWKGYTCELDKAGKYTREQVSRMRDTDVPWPVEYVDAHSIRHFRSDIEGIRNPLTEGTPIEDPNDDL